MTASSMRSGTGSQSAKSVSVSSIASGAVGRSSVYSAYSADQQVRYLQLQAEMETLILELQATSQQRSQPDRSPARAAASSQ